VKCEVLSVKCAVCSVQCAVGGRKVGSLAYCTFRLNLMALFSVGTVTLGTSGWVGR